MVMKLKLIKKKEIKQLQKKIKTGKKTKTLSEQEIWKLEDKINELKNKN